MIRPLKKKKNQYVWLLDVSTLLKRDIAADVVLKKKEGCLRPVFLSWVSSRIIYKFLNYQYIIPSDIGDLIVLELGWTSIIF